MMNMSYCRFENTYYALNECMYHIEDEESTSENEMRYAKRLYESCREFMEKYEHYGIKPDEYDED